MAKNTKKKDQHNLGKIKTQNLVAKHSRDMGGAGKHVDKTGDKAPRVRQKRAWKRGIQFENNLIGQAHTELMFDESDPFEQGIKEIEKQFGIDLSEGKCGGSHENEESGFTPQQIDDMNKLVGQYEDGAADPSNAGKDLEMLEYQPNEVEAMVAHIMRALKK